MRTNLPVTTTEYTFSDDDMLVSATDLSSIIQYCNPAFIEVSGFTHDELIGQPHNLIRHPDMPPEAFADLWATVKQGKSWTALVKNRRKNGDFYWVRANVTPIVQNGQTVGYLSVRTRPDRDEVRDAESLYARLRAGQAGSGRLVGGTSATPGSPVPARSCGAPATVRACWPPACSGRPRRWRWPRSRPRGRRGCWPARRRPSCSSVRVCRRGA